MIYEQLRDELRQRDIFHGKTWKLSPEAFILSEEQRALLPKIGNACKEFYLAIDRLYYLAKEGKKILRNSDCYADWVLDYWETGKSQDLIQHISKKQFKGSLPLIIRPDLLITEEGFQLTELDSTPGGYGLTPFLNNLYGIEHSMLETFYAGFQAIAKKENPNVLILIKDEALTYLSEYQWIKEQLRAQGFFVRVEQVESMGSLEGVDVIYRFFDLYDLENIPVIEEIREAEQSGQLVVTPPMKSFQEEKLNLGLFYHEKLADYWNEVLSKPSKKILEAIIPKSWIMDPRPLGPHGVLVGPEINGKRLANWRELGKLSQKNRQFVMKLSGFHEKAWGARSVVIGHDCSSEDWIEAIEASQSKGLEELRLLQEFAKPKRIQHPVYNEYGGVTSEALRVRLCPYYISEPEMTFTGALATLCPADKKIIHGMEDAVMLPAM